MTCYGKYNGSITYKIPQITILVMGGAKKKPSGSEKSARDSGSGGENVVKKEETKKPSGKPQQKQKLSVLVEESQGRRAIQSTKAITIQGVARAVGVKISVANAYIRSLEAKGIVKSVGGYSGHRVYQLVEQV
jgi:small subunit ribosomal protein S25e